MVGGMLRKLEYSTGPHTVSRLTSFSRYLPKVIWKHSKKYQMKIQKKSFVIQFLIWLVTHHGTDGESSERLELFAHALTAEMGAPISYARQAQVPLAAAHLRVARDLLATFPRTCDKNC